jgi:hypothetical protein
MLKILLKLFLIIGIMTTISVIIPDAFTSKIDGAFMYFLGQMYVLQPFFNVDVLIDCMQIVAGFFYSLGTFLFFFIIFKMTD